MDPFHDEKAKDILEAITADEIMTISNKYLNNPCFSVSGSKQICVNLKEIWKKKY